MTLRFFGRATRTPQKKEAAPSAQPEASPAPRRSRRGRRGSGATKKAAAATNAVSQPAPSAPANPPSRTRRGRRGGAGRKPAANRSDGQTPAVAEAIVQEPPPPKPANRAQPGTIEALLARQEEIMEQVMERQLTALKGVQGSLSAIESRLSTMGSFSGDRQRVGVFVDVPNVVYAAERLRAKVDYAKMLNFIVRGRDLVRASAYSPVSDDLMEPIAAQKFVQPFMGHGYAMITKPLKRYADGTIKANFDVELAIDILTICERLDVVVLVSGDGDFRRLVELVCSKGIRVEVVAFGDSTAAELRTAADQYIDLKDHLPELRTK
jgi:uncharacterized LabA/DUF88 family protein